MTAGAWLALAATIAVAGLLGLLLWETARLVLRRTPITGLVRYQERVIRFHWLAVAYFCVGLLVGWLLDHFAHF